MTVTVQNFNSSKPAKLLYKTILSDAFNIAAIGNFLMRSHSSQTLSCTVFAHYKTL